MAVRFLILFLFISFGLSAQVYQTNSAPYQFTRGTKNDTILVIPRGADTPTIGNNKFGAPTIGAIFYKTADSTLWLRSATKWNQLTGGSIVDSVWRVAGIDSIYVRNRLGYTYALKDSAGGASENFANADLTATGNRTHTFGTNSLLINNALSANTYGGILFDPTNISLYNGTYYDEEAKVNEASLYLSGSDTSNIIAQLIARRLDQSSGVRAEYFDLKNRLLLGSDSIFLYNSNFSSEPYTPTTTSTAKYKAVLMDSTTGALVTTSPSNIGGGIPSDSLAIRKSGPNLIHLTSYNSGYNSATVGSSASAARVDSANFFVGLRSGLAGTTGYRNITIGRATLKSLTTGYGNVAIGDSAGSSLKTGYDNFYFGANAGRADTSGIGNIAIGELALSRFNGDGAASNNSNRGQIAIGSGALQNATAYSLRANNSANVAVGNNALQNTTTGWSNTAIGTTAGVGNTTGYNNVSVGYRSGSSAAQTGIENIAIGAQALNANTSGSSNIAIGGLNPLVSSSTGSNNIAIGHSSLTANTTAGTNISIGNSAMNTSQTGASNVVIGHNAVTGGSTSLTGYNRNPSESIVIGYQAGNQLSANSNTIIGYQANYNNLNVAAQNAFRGTKNIVIGYKASQPDTTAGGQVTIGADGVNWLQRFNGGGWLVNNTSSAVLTATASAAFEINGTTGGFLPPRMTTAERDAIGSPESGLTVFNTSNNQAQVKSTNWRSMSGDSAHFVNAARLMNSGFKAVSVGCESPIACMGTASSFSTSALFGVAIYVPNQILVTGVNCLVAATVTSMSTALYYLDADSIRYIDSSVAATGSSAAHINSFAYTATHTLTPGIYFVLYRALNSTGTLTTSNLTMVAAFQGLNSSTAAMFMSGSATFAPASGSFKQAWGLNEFTRATRLFFSALY